MLTTLLPANGASVLLRAVCFDALREARARSDLLSLETLQEKCDEFIEQLRDSPRRQGEKRTRRVIWSDPEVCVKCRHSDI